MSIDGWMGNQDVTQPYNGALLSLQKEDGSDTGYNMDGLQGHCIKYLVPEIKTLTKGQIKGWVWWLTPGIPATQEAVDKRISA
jgi:hypothetical protein